MCRRVWSKRVALERHGTCTTLPSSPGSSSAAHPAAAFLPQIPRALPAPPRLQWDDSKPCGRCALVTCVDSRCKVPGRQVAVFFVDQ